MEEEKTIYFVRNKDLIYTNIKCPFCSTKDFKGLPHMEVECKTCGKTHLTDLKVPMYSQKLPVILAAMKLS
jgi:uncharacterized Zn finger protein